MHKLLIRQLKRVGLDHAGDVHITASKWEKLLATISESYEQLDKDKAMVERTLKLASDELFERNRDLRKNVQELESQQRIIRFQARYDTLTKLPNRSYYIEQFDQILKDENAIKKFAVLFIDLDKFKHINDHYGHEYGDKLLCIISERLQSCLREGDILARFGGDEFMAIIKDIDDRDSVLKVVERFRQKTAEPFQIYEHEFQISSSIGVSIYPQDGADRETLIRKADLAMYHAKEKGRNTIECYNPLSCE